MLHLPKSQSSVTFVTFGFLDSDRAALSAHEIMPRNPLKDLVLGSLDHTAEPNRTP